MSARKTYDSTVARIAGNIASGLVEIQRLRRWNGITKINEVDKEYAADVASESVALARAIVAEVERTEPEAK